MAKNPNRRRRMALTYLRWMPWLFLALGLFWVGSAIVEIATGDVGPNGGNLFSLVIGCIELAIGITLCITQLVHGFPVAGMRTGAPKELHERRTPEDGRQREPTTSILENERNH